MVGGRWDGYKDEQDRGSAFRDLEAWKIKQVHRNTMQNRAAGRLHNTFREGSVWRETTAHLGGIWQGLCGGKISSGRGWVKGIPRRENNTFWGTVYLV